MVLGRPECLFLTKQGFLALGVNEWSLPGHQSSGRMTDAVGRSSFSLSSYGFVGVPARNAPACTGFLPTRPGVPLCSLFGALVVGSDSRIDSEAGAAMLHGLSGGEDLCEVEVVRKGEGAGFEPMTCSGGVLCFRARRRCCTEAMSEVGCNSSPGLFGSLLFITSFSVNNVYSLISALQWYSDAQNLEYSSTTSSSVVL